MNYAFYISGGSDRLYKFLKTTSRKNVESVKIVVSDAEIPTLLSDQFNSLSIKYVGVNYKMLGENNQERNLAFSNILLNYLLEYEVDYMFSFGKHLLSGEVLKKYQWRLINFHPSLLPMYPGINAIDQAVAQGNTLLVGNTAHFITQQVDAGPIIMQSVIPIKAFHNKGNDYNCVLDLIIPMLNTLMELLENQQISIENGVVNIAGADYEKPSLFPHING